MAIANYVEAQGAVMRARQLRQGAGVVSILMTRELQQGMVLEAERLEGEVRQWCSEQECPEEADALAHRRFWELDVQGRLLRSAVAA